MLFFCMEIINIFMRIVQNSPSTIKLCHFQHTHQRMSFNHRVHNLGKVRITLVSLCVCGWVSIEFVWHLGDWTVCSASCGDRGRRVRRARCVSPGGREVSPAMCHHLPRPVAPPVGCNIQDCPPRLVQQCYVVAAALTQEHMYHTHTDRHKRTPTFAHKDPLKN